MLRNSSGLASECQSCQETRFKYSKLKDLLRSHKMQIAALEETIHQQRLDLAHARRIADEEKTQADLLRGDLTPLQVGLSWGYLGTITGLNVSHHQTILEAKRELEASTLKLTLQVDREKASKAELKTQLTAALAGA